MRKDAGSVTMFAAIAYAEPQREWRRGTSPSTSPAFACRRLAPGIRWSTAHWSTRVSEPAATRAASAAKAQARSAALRRDTHAQCAGDDLEADGRRSDLLAVQFD